MQAPALPLVALGASLAGEAVSVRFASAAPPGAEQAGVALAITAVAPIPLCRARAPAGHVTCKTPHSSLLHCLPTDLTTTFA